MIDPMKMAEKTAALALATSAPGTAETMRMVADNLRTFRAGYDEFIKAVAMGTIDAPHAAMESFMKKWMAKTTSDDVWSVWENH
jgi:predicted solute-binding protein